MSAGVLPCCVSRDILLLSSLFREFRLEDLGEPGSGEAGSGGNEEGDGRLSEEVFSIFSELAWGVAWFAVPSLSAEQLDWFNVAFVWFVFRVSPSITDCKSGNNHPRETLFPGSREDVVVVAAVVEVSLFC